MSLPEATRIELPILQELQAAGGSDQVRYLYDRLRGYFPQLTEADLNERTIGGRSRWHLIVQRAGKQLEFVGELKREPTHWTITTPGKKRVEAEALQLNQTPPATENGNRRLSHKDVQLLLVEIGQWLGRYAETEFEHYDVVWRSSAQAPRLSHVFEVQIAGSVDGALTRLKQAHETQRSQPFLVIGDERDTTFAQKRLAHTFHELQDHVTVVGVGEVQRLHAALKNHVSLLRKLSTS